jgi:hypothetical protein
LLKNYGKIFYISSILFCSTILWAQQDDNLLAFERACLYHIVKKSPSLDNNFGSYFEYTGPKVIFPNGQINYDSIEQIITNRPDLLLIRKQEISKGSAGLLAELSNKMAVLELNKILLEKRTSIAANKAFDNPRYKSFEIIFTKKLPAIAFTINDTLKRPNKDIYLFTDPALTFKQKVEFLSKNKTYSEEDKRMIINAFYNAINSYIEKRCYEFYLSLGGIATDFESHLIAAGEGGNTAGLLAEFEKNLSGKWTISLPRAIGLFPYQIEELNTQKIEPKRISTIQMKTSGNNRITNLHFDVWGYNSEKQTTVVIEKNGSNYVLFGAGDTKFLSPDSSFSNGNTLLSVIQELEQKDIGKLKERISGKKGIEEKLQTKIDKRAQIYETIQKEESKYIQFSNGKIKLKKSTPRKIRNARRKALDFSSLDSNNHFLTAIKSKKQKRQRKQTNLLELYHEYENLTRQIQELQISRTKELEKLSYYSEKLDYYKTAMGENILAYSIIDSLYIFDDSSTFDLRTQEFQFKPSEKAESFNIRLISIPDNAKASSADEVMLHVSKIEQDPKLTATIKLNLSDQFDSDKCDLKNDLFSPTDSLGLKIISEIIFSNKTPLIIKASGYGIGKWDGNTVVKDQNPLELDGYPNSKNDTTFSRLRKTALYVQTNHKLEIEIESFTDPIKSGIQIYNKILLETVTKYNLSKNDLLSGLRSKAVLLKFQDEFIKWVGKNYDAEKARIIIDRFNQEFQKTKVNIGGFMFKLKELNLE